MSNQASAADSSSWTRNLQRGGSGGGFWNDAAWYDAHLAQRMPLHGEALRRMTLVLPPLAPEARVLDFLGGSGAAAEAVASVYSARIHVLDSSAERLKRAAARFERALLPPPTLIEHSATLAAPVPTSTRGAGFHLITAALALHHLLEHTQQSSDEKLASFRAWLTALHDLLQPGGHLFIVDHVGQLPVCTQLQQLLTVGFIDVDVAWRVDDMFVIGARRALDGAKAAPTSAAASYSKQAAHVAPPPVALPATAASLPVVASPAAPAAISQPVSAVAASHSLHPSLSDDEQINQMIAALQAQNEDLKARLAAAPSPQAQPTDGAAASSAVSAVSATPVAPAPALSSDALYAKLPALFSRFDPSRSGQLSFAALQQLCRAVGRPCGDDDSGDDSLWWTYQSVAQADPNTGSVGLSLEDLSVHFYQSGVFDLRNDLAKLHIL